MAEKSSFAGFGKDCQQFFKDLEENNHREWFLQNKARYEKSVVNPALGFIEHFGQKLQQLDKQFYFDLRTNGAGSLFRIYRDTRFSKDKTPFKTNLGILFWIGEKSKLENPGMYFELGATHAKLYAGLYEFSKEFLEKYRKHLTKKGQGDKLRKILETLNLADYETGRVGYKRVPAGFSLDHPYEELLRYNGLFAQSPPIPNKSVASKKISDICFEHATNMQPLINWILAVKS